MTTEEIGDIENELGFVKEDIEVAERNLREYRAEVVRLEARLHAVKLLEAMK